MTQDQTDTARQGSTIAPEYSQGSYFGNTQRHREDARFKADAFLQVFLRYQDRSGVAVSSLVDVGCGSGDIVKMIADSLNASAAMTFKGYDVSPHIVHVSNAGVTYVHGDFCESAEFVDVVTLFDVFEHVPDPIDFISKVAQRCQIIGFHVPLDDAWSFALRNRYRRSLHNPGHLVFLDTVSALNLLALAGLRVVDYEYTFAFRAPSGHSTWLAKLVYPVRAALAKISPWLLSKTLGGASLLVLALTPAGLRAQAAAAESAARQ